MMMSFGLKQDASSNKKLSLKPVMSHRLRLAMSHLEHVEGLTLQNASFVTAVLEMRQSIDL